MKSLKENCSQLILNEPFLVLLPKEENESIFKQLKQDDETVYYLPYDPSTTSTTSTTSKEKENTKPLNYNKNKRKRYTSTNFPYKKPLLKLQDTTRTLKLLKKYRAQQTLESCTTQWRSVAEEASDKLFKYIKEMSHSNAEGVGGGGGGNVKWTVKKMFQSMRLDVKLLELSSSSEEEEEEEDESEVEEE
ncbi:hypothetical protein MP638_003714 [Amoeboaphelidium occidentale]|nr:hypothetical protein MP638_003714 [Amoeboaphelidium occidentale]